MANPSQGMSAVTEAIINAAHAFVAQPDAEHQAALEAALAAPQQAEAVDDTARLARIVRGHMSGLASYAMEVEERDSTPYAAGWCAATDHAIGCLETHLAAFDAAREARHE